jgi:hypothetical protein
VPPADRGPDARLRSRTPVLGQAVARCEAFGSPELKRRSAIATSWSQLLAGAARVRQEPVRSARRGVSRGSRKNLGPPKAWG